MLKSYMTQYMLREFLRENLPAQDWVSNVGVPGSGAASRCRPDFRSESLKTIVEFDGYLHYTSAKTQYNDQLKDSAYSGMGYKVIRVPYFVQLSKIVARKLFGVRLRSDYNVYPHGFIDPKSLKPCDFNLYGLKRFHKELTYYKSLPIVSNTLKHNQGTPLSCLFSTVTVKKFGISP